ncbi:SIT4 phosphatase-associated protein-domain-containing protein [Fimicolochytrium jonesii]|uniref:SIT4 phosphatase-associated protein-domain-containing protein n=1 Tax=Fimicolochytrium jonesii TaxID=1396493 RepID=UPI0022FF1D7B|nr:SIT4 phosphatase-associated protein-domain-containing protein [Fimicolochytrium jonesii]KAI8824378.1 SIT4 phosphatase-associated protein-domain-containing protein [Fimicolochytrium jonesii]
MFWRFGFHNASVIDGLLEKEGVTLDELLEEDELMQECKAHNTKLVEFLSKPEVLKQLLGFIIKSEDLDESKRFKYPFVASEIISCEIYSICEGIMGSEELLNELWGLLDRPAPLDALTASHFGKVIGVLLAKKTPEMVAFIRKQPNVVQQLLTHIACSAISDLLLKLISMNDIPEGAGIVEWLSKEGLITTLLSRLDPKLDSEVHNTAAQTLLDVIAVSYQTVSPQDMMNAGFGGSLLGEEAGLPPPTPGNTLVDELKSEGMMNKLASYMLDDPSSHSASALMNGINIIIELIRRYCSEIEQAEYLQHQYQLSQAHQRQAISPPSQEKLKALATDLNDLLHVIGDRLTQFAELLHGPPKSENPTTTGQITPLGSERLKTCELFAEILHLQYLYTSSPLFERFITAGFHDPSEERAEAKETPSDSGESTKSPPTPPHPERRVADELVAITDKFIDAKVLPACLDLFFRYPWNNFLHSVVYDMIAKVFNTYQYTSSINLIKSPETQKGVEAGSPTAATQSEPVNPAQAAVEKQMGAVQVVVRKLVLSIFQDGQLTKQIIRAQKENDEHVAKPKGVRLGFMGHLTYIADEVSKLLEKCPEDLVKELSDHIVADEWHSYVSGPLKETRERDRQPLGGVRPNAGPQNQNIPILGAIGGSFTGAPEESEEVKIRDDLYQEAAEADDDDDDDDEALSGITGGDNGLPGDGDGTTVPTSPREEHDWEKNVDVWSADASYD